MFDVLADTTPGRVLSRAEISRRAGIADLSDRRCDSLIVGIRRRIGAELRPHGAPPRLDARHLTRLLPDPRLP